MQQPALVTPALMQPLTQPTPIPASKIEHQEDDQQIMIEDLMAGDTYNFNDVLNADQEMYDMIESLHSDTLKERFYYGLENGAK